MLQFFWNLKFLKLTLLCCRIQFEKKKNFLKISPKLFLWVLKPAEYDCDNGRFLRCRTEGLTSIFSEISTFLIDLEKGYIGAFRCQHGFIDKKLKQYTLEDLHVGFSENCKFVPWPWIDVYRGFRRPEHTYFHDMSLPVSHQGSVCRLCRTSPVIKQNQGQD